MKNKSPVLASLFLVPACVFLLSCASLSGPERYVPDSGHGPVVLMISGKTGTLLYGEFAERLAKAGYYVLLYNGNDFPIDRPDACRTKIRDIIRDEIRLQGLTGKAAFIGYSLGGAVALSCAAGIPEEIAGIIAYYPATRLIPDHHACVDRFRLPILVLQGEDDRYLNCCTVEKIREIKDAAQKKGREVELIVYPRAGHGFNLGPTRDKDLDGDSWRKTMDALRKYLR